MTAYDNIEFPLRSLKISKAEEQKKINEVSEILVYHTCLIIIQGNYQGVNNRGWRWRAH